MYQNLAKTVVSQKPKPEVPVLARKTSKFGGSTMQPVQTPTWEKVKIKFKPFYVVFKGKLNIYATDRHG